MKFTDNSQYGNKTFSHASLRSGRRRKPALLRIAVAGIVELNVDRLAQAEILETTIAPSSDKEAAVIATLAPGSYTAIVRGKNNGAGVGLVEVYNLQ